MKSIGLPICKASVLAMLDHRKTQTRRIIKPQPRNGIRRSVFSPSGLEDLHGYALKAPAHPGDELWFREKLHKLRGQVAYHADNTLVVPIEVRDARLDLSMTVAWPWKRDVLPAIFMPRYACRLFRTLADIRAERLQDISDVDIEEEGIEPVEDASGFGDDLYLTRLDFAKWWDELHGPGAWGRNEWVFVYTFRPLPS